MARQLTTKAQVNGYRFLLSRLEHALVRRDARMLHDPMRSSVRALALGTVLTVLALAGFGIWGLIRPQGTVGQASILVGKQSGGMYVVVDEKVHPVLNLASARLITGSDSAPKSVADSALSAYPRGPLLGIPGAPVALPASAHRDTSVWSVCDHPGTGEDTTRRLAVIADRPATGAQIAPAGPQDAVLVTDGRATFLVYQVVRGEHSVPVRAEVDMHDAAVTRAFGLADVTPRLVGVGVLNTLPEVAPLAVPRIGGAGMPSDLPIPDVSVGSVIRTVGVNGHLDYYVVLTDSVQPIGEATAEMLRLADPGSPAEVPTRSPAPVNAAPRSDSLPVTEFPSHAPHLVSSATAPTICSVWSRGSADPTARTSLLLGRGLPLPAGVDVVTPAGADGAGPLIDEVYLPAGSGEFIQTTGNEDDSTRTESLFYLNDSGVRFGVADMATAQVLGLGTTPASVPWAVASLLVAGPTLSRHDALVAHDGIAADPSGRAVPEPEN
ncbi:type VII secretion protein EccB [Gordonia sp. VNK1]|uniref:type VII secretion protein EccB n=1 Tax=Gordonia oleivorans TaxID=3156618 RepID=UPI0032B55D98